ncbi:MAG: DUF4421 family protein [Eudoraea sp.]|uniref:DUF4421 family protein n=1 Tax=Eudoraea sp. TaxID=1979955 RepID=UPI003265FFDF
MFIDGDKSHMSIRALANFKDDNFKLSNSENTLLYTPNNPGGVGVGFASSKLVLDLILNIKSNKEEVTDRFDVQGNILLKQEYFVFQIQHYKGFNVRNTSINDPGIFRRDISSFVTSLSYLHIFNSEVQPFNHIQTGVNNNPKSDGSFLAGSYFNYHRVKGDSTIVTESSKDLFNDEAQIVDVEKFAVGISGGYAYFLKLSKKFHVLAVLTPGFGIHFSNIQTETIRYKADEPWEMFAYANIVLGYNTPKFYMEFHAENVLDFWTLGYGNKGSMNSSKLKFVFGWKFVKSKVKER